MVIILLYCYTLVIEIKHAWVREFPTSTCLWQFSRRLSIRIGYLINPRMPIFLNIPNVYGVSKGFSS